MSDEEIVRALTALSDLKIGAYVDFSGPDAQRAIEIAETWPFLMSEPTAGGVRITRIGVPLADLTQVHGEHIETCPYSRAELPTDPEAPSGALWVWKDGHGKLFVAPGSEMHADVTAWVAKGDLVISEAE